jgi:hypothetical protein
MSGGCRGLLFERNRRDTGAKRPIAPFWRTAPSGVLSFISSRPELSRRCLDAASLHFFLELVRQFGNG